MRVPGWPQVHPDRWWPVLCVLLWKHFTTTCAECQQFMGLTQWSPFMKTATSMRAAAAVLTSWSLSPSLVRTMSCSLMLATAVTSPPSALPMGRPHAWVPEAGIQRPEVYEHCFPCRGCKQLLGSHSSCPTCMPSIEQDADTKDVTYHDQPWHWECLVYTGLHRVLDALPRMIIPIAWPVLESSLHPSTAVTRAPSQDMVEASMGSSKTTTGTIAASPSTSIETKCCARAAAKQVFPNYLWDLALPQIGVSPGLQDSVSLLQHPQTSTPWPRAPKPELLWSSMIQIPFVSLSFIIYSPLPYSLGSQTKPSLQIRALDLQTWTLEPRLLQSRLFRRCFSSPLGAWGVLKSGLYT